VAHGWHDHVRFTTLCGHHAPNRTTDEVAAFSPAQLPIESNPAVMNRYLAKLGYPVEVSAAPAADAPITRHALSSPTRRHTALPAAVQMLRPAEHGRLGAGNGEGAGQRLQCDLPSLIRSHHARRFHAPSSRCSCCTPSRRR